MGSDLKMPSVQRQVESVATSGTEPPMGIDLERAAARWEDEGHCPSVEYVALARELAEALSRVQPVVGPLTWEEYKAVLAKARAAGLLS